MSETRPDHNPPDDRNRPALSRNDDAARRDRDAAERDEKAAQADRSADRNDRRTEGLETDESSTHSDAQVWRTRFTDARRSAAQDRLRAARDRDAARSDRAAAAADRHRSALDDLTGAYRREAGMFELEIDFERARGTGQILVIGFLDVDGLKEINDKYGHAAGDEVLRRVADAVRTHLRPEDILIRYGGDEFVFSVLGLGEQPVRERLAAAASMLRTAAAGSISCGFALAAGAVTITEAIDTADADLYRSRGAERRAHSTGIESTASSSATPTTGMPANPESSTLAPVDSNKRTRVRHRGRGSLHVADEFDRPATDVRVNAPRSAVSEPGKQIEAVLADLGSVRPMFQPIVDLTDGAVVGYEALARWPLYPGIDPAAVFAAAADRGVLAELDGACRTSALDAALAADLPHGHTVFLNVEPDTAHSFPDRADARIDEGSGHLDIVLELTERSLLSDPASLLHLVDRARSGGCRIALDDIGCHPDSLALLDFIAPDIIKLDRSLIQQDPSPQRARIIAAVTAHAESTGAMILAEGIETDIHLDRGRAYGAALGQGWMFGRPAPLPHPADARWSATTHGAHRPRHRSLDSAAGRVPAVPSDVFDYALPSIGRKTLVAAITRQIEQHAKEAREPMTILSTFQDARFFSAAVAARYAELAATHSFVAALGIGMPDEPAPGVHGTNLHPEEPFTRQWTLTVVGAHYVAAVIARDLGDTGEDGDRRFEFLHTHDRDIVVAAARSLMRRVIPARTRYQ